ncbi:MAG: hypothetical protein Tp118SUR00d2C21406351_43 [Prokaryotic dsDNA virus sp.]|nr:MAG: hypothetical protein Tp118SUR00d2C21406351_43 [Prokaryotic dsDNA virus sp.]|tara:strand:- start:28918 stop:29403 length:486 start_codon:yes stop_codon:yes gene_type:complete
MAIVGGYTLNHNAAYAGMVADGQLLNSVSRVNKGTDNILFGKGLVSDGEDGAKLPVPASTAAQFNGVLKRELNRAHTDADPQGALPKYDMTVVTEGVIWVTVLDTVAKDAPVYLRVGATDAGDFSGIAGTGDTAGVLLPNAKFLTAGDAGDLVKISLGLGG